MRIAIVHYHLRRGGVSRVIEHAVRSLEDSDVRPVVLVGEAPPEDGFPLHSVRAVDGIDYAENHGDPPAETLADRMEAAARDALGGPPDVWHFHNHGIGKNCALTDAAALLARRGNRLLLQIHDFAEDGRPHLFRDILQHLGNGEVRGLGDRMYPQAPHIHYATINGRDLKLLASLGVAPERLHLIPNAATLESEALDEWNPNPEGTRLVLYPIRAIRRKNLGEFLLWTALDGRDERFAVTLAPKSAHDRVAYDEWVQFAGDRRLPVEFGVGLRNDMPFSERLRSSWIAVSTSVAEGFGLTFLEPWLVNRPVLGRKIPDITHEFEEAGVDLSALYDKLLVPMDWIDRDALHRRIGQVYAGMLATYGRQPKAGDVEKAVAAAITGDRIDFGRLDEGFQQEIIGKLIDSPALRRELAPDNIAPPDGMADVIGRNRDVIGRTYSLRQYGRRLESVYGKVADSGVGAVDHGLDVGRLLDEFLAPERFCLLRT